MGKTIVEKIASAASGTDAKAGDIVWANVDCAMADDILGPRIFDRKFQELGMPIWDPRKVVVISDHYSPAANVAQADILSFTRNWAKEHGTHYYEGEGPCHQILADYGFDQPGTLICGTDSHTTTAGAFGAFAIGIGSTEMLGILATGQIWLRVPESIRVHWNGSLPRGVFAKDMILTLLRDLSQSGGTYQAIEFAGDTVKALSLDERMCLTNMTAELGAKAGIVEADEKVFDFLSEFGPLKGKVFQSDADAAYVRTLNYDASQMVPVVACPHEVDNVHPITQVDSGRIHQAFIGSCTGGRYDDLKMAAEVLKGNKVSPDVRMLVSPASKKIYMRALRDGIIETLMEAGATVMMAACGPCIGLHSGIIGSGEQAISASNRNFIGRMGSSSAGVYLGSAATVAASAIEGRVADPRHYLS